MLHIGRRALTAIGAGAAVIAVVVALLVDQGPGKVHLTAYFTNSVGVYRGSEVRLMGVPIGRVDSVTPSGGRVRIEMTYDGRYHLPADADAVIISPSVVSDRFVQLTPAYGGSGPVLRDHATLGLSRTRVPVELDQIYSVTNSLLSTLGPHGANEQGSVNELLKVGANNLSGQGAHIGRMIDNLAGASATLDGSSKDFFATVGHLSKLTDSLAANDATVRTFDSRMADVATFLASEREELGRALQNLAAAFSSVDSFVTDNQALLAANVNSLAKITTTLANQREALRSLLQLLPVAASNMARSWDPVNQSVRARANESELTKNINGVLCDAIQHAGIAQPTALCDLLGQLVRGVNP